MNRKDRILNSMLVVACGLWISFIPIAANAQADSAAKPARESILYLQYFLKDNKIPYLKIQTKNKTEEGFAIAKKIPVSVYLDEDNSKDALIGTESTNDEGELMLAIPVTLSAKWKTQPTHTFYAHTESSPAFDAVSKEVPVVLAKLQLDTVAGASAPTFTASVVKSEGGSWVPMQDVEVKIGVKRLGGYLNVGEEDAYTTDSTGKVEVEFIRANLPGDKLGKLEVVAMVDDNEEIGSLQTSMIVPWGVVHEYKSDFGQRSLWAPPRKAPLWLMLMAYGCIIAVWSMIIYLITRIIQIKKLGKSSQ